GSGKAGSGWRCGARCGRLRRRGRCALGQGTAIVREQSCSLRRRDLFRAAISAADAERRVFGATLGLGIGGVVRKSADANSEHAWNDMFLYPICQEKNAVPVIFLWREADSRDFSPELSIMDAVREAKEATGSRYSSSWRSSLVSCVPLIRRAGGCFRD